MGSNDLDCTEDYDDLEQFCLGNDGRLNRSVETYEL